MNQPTGKQPNRSIRGIQPINRLDVASVGLTLATIALTWAMARYPMELPDPHPVDSAIMLSPTLGIGIYIFMYAVFTLLAYRMSYGLYAGFQHIAVAAAFLNFGPVAATITAFAGRFIAVIGRAFFYKQLQLRPHGAREAVVSLMFHAGAHGFSILASGLVYLLFSGILPLTTLYFRLLIPLLLMFVTNVALYQGLLIIRVYWSGTFVDRRKLNEAFPTLFFGQAFSIPLSILLSICYFSLPPLAFLMLIGGALMAALLFRISEKSRWSLERRIVELATMHSIGQSITSSLNMTDLMQSIYNQVRQLMEAQTFYIALYAADSQTVSFPFVMQNGRRTTWPARQEEHGITEYIIQSGELLLLSGSLKEEAARFGATNLEGNAACYIGVPLSAGDEVLGVLSVQSTGRPNAYGPSEVAVLSTIASQAAVAMRNASLYNRVWEMADELALLNNVSSVVTATLDLSIVLDTTCAVVIQIGHADKTGIFLTSEDGMSLRLVHSIGLSDDYVAQFQNIRREDESGPTQVLSQTAAMAISNVHTDPRGLGWRTLAEVEGYVGLLTVPLIASEQVIGFLAAFYAQSHLFGKSELDLMNTLANQVAVTVANARLYQDTQAHAQAMTRLVEASRAFTASLDLNSVAQKVLEELVGVLVPDVAAMFLVAPNGELHPVAQRGIESLDVMIPVGSVAQAIATRTALVLPITSEDLLLLKQLVLQSLYVLPLVGQDKVLGVVFVGHETLRHFDDRERQLAEALVNQAATAVRNAQLYSQTDAALADRVSELSAIEEISRQISGSLDLDHIINNVLDTAISVTQADLAGCALVVNADHINYVERYGKDSGRMQIAHAIQGNIGMIGYVLQTGNIARVGDVREDLYYRPSMVPDVLSALCVPVMHKGERVGVINLESRHLNAFTPVHERFLVTLADHAAVAIGNANLFEERQAQIETLIKFRNFSLELLSAASLREVMNLVVEYAVIIAHAKDVHLYLYDRVNESLSFGASLWLDGRENIEAASPRRNGRTWKVAYSGQAQLIEDVKKLQPPPEFRDGPGFGAIARIPLKRAGEVIGVLNIAFRDAHYFTENEIRAFDLLANQAAIAIENARLFDEVRIGHDRMRAILDSTRDGVILLGHNGQVVMANPPAEKLLGYNLNAQLGKNLMRVMIEVSKLKGSVEGIESIRKMTHQMLADMTNTPDKITRYDFQTGSSSVQRDIETMLLPVNDKEGKVAGRLVVLRDISEEKSMERFREELTNMIVHDLRSPLSGVISSLRLIEDMIADNDFTGLSQVLGIAITSSENQMRMIESMLEMDKLEHGHLPLHISVTALEPLVRKAITALDVLAVGAKVHLVDCVPPDLPPIIMDEELIRRVLVNLMDNALRHTPAEGEVRVEASVIESTGEAKIGILDTGKGIPLEFRDRIFEKFVQVPKSALRGQRGIGLGLTFCRLAVEAHGGRIWADSAPSGGAAFWFTLPLVQRPDQLTRNN